MNGRTRLLAWMNRAGLNQKETARDIGLNYTQLSKILTGRQTPGLRNAVLIERYTGIPVEAWLPIEDGKPVKRVKSEPEIVNVA